MNEYKNFKSTANSKIVKIIEENSLKIVKILLSLIEEQKKKLEDYQKFKEHHSNVQADRDRS